MRPGERGSILRTEGNDALAGRLRALGFVRGAEVSCERLSPFGDPMLLRLRGFRVALRREEGARIMLEKGEGHENHSVGRESELREIRII